jgi:hypothetical protein
VEPFHGQTSFTAKQVSLGFAQPIAWEGEAPAEPWSSQLGGSLALLALPLGRSPLGFRQLGHQMICTRVA